MKKLPIIAATTTLLMIVSGVGLSFPRSALAVCPICTVAVGAGLGLSRYLGIDDSLTGIWIGGLIISLTLWTIDWLKKKDFKLLRNLDTKITTIIALAIWILLTYPPLYWAGLIGHPFNTILGIDKLIFGSILGAIAFALGVFGDKKVRQIRGKQLFNYQKVAFPIISLILFSLVLYFFGGYLYKL
jgi:hypothetical protein